jgi:predicted Zn-dependent protease
MSRHPFSLRPLLLLALSALTVVSASDAAAWSASFAREGAGDFSGALAALEPLRAAPADPYLLALRSAWLDHRLGHDEVALAMYAQAGSVKPSSLEPQLGRLSCFIALKRWSEAEIAACAVLKAAPGNYLAGCGLVEALLGAGRSREAADIVKPLVSQYPADAGVLDLAVRCHAAVGDTAGADELSARLAVLKLAWAPQVAKR